MVIHGHVCVYGWKIMELSMDGECVPRSGHIRTTYPYDL